MLPVRCASPFSSDDSITHWKYIKNILLHLNATKIAGITYNGNENGNIEFNADDDFASDTVDYKPNTGSIILFNESRVSWMSITEYIVAYRLLIISLTSCRKTVIDFNKLLSDLKLNFEIPDILTKALQRVSLSLHLHEEMNLD